MPNPSTTKKKTTTSVYNLGDAEPTYQSNPALTGMRPVADPYANTGTYLLGADGEKNTPKVVNTVKETPVTPPVTPPTTGDKGGGNGFNASEYLANYPTYYSPTAGASYSYSGALPTYSFNQALPTYSFNQATPGEFQWDRERPADFTYDKERPADFAYDAVKPEYSNAYQDRIDAMVDQILNRPQFTYDYTQDPLYAQYAEAYTRNGQQAMNDTHAQIAARTGGLASSYAGTAAQQQYNQYMQALNDKIPELYKLAYSMYQDEGNTQRNNLSMLQGLESTDYGRYMDQLGQYNTDRNFAYDVWQGQQNQYENDRNLAYNQWLANQNQYENDRNFAYNQYNDAWDRYYNDRNFTYGQYQDALGQWNTDRNFTYGQYVDALQQYNTDRNFNYNVWSDDIARQEAAARNAYNAQVAAYNAANKVSATPAAQTPTTPAAPAQTIDEWQRELQALASQPAAQGGPNTRNLQVTMDQNGYLWRGQHYKTVDELGAAIDNTYLRDAEWNVVKQSYDALKTTKKNGSGGGGR